MAVNIIYSMERKRKREGIRKEKKEGREGGRKEKEKGFFYVQPGRKREMPSFLYFFFQLKFNYKIF